MRATVMIAAAAIGLLAQPSRPIAGRIESAPLGPADREAAADAYRRRDIAALEKILAAASGKEPARAPELKALLGALEFINGRPAQAVARLREAEPLLDQDRFTLAMALVNLSERAGARTELSRLHQAHPDEPLYLYWLGRLDYDQRLYPDAVAKFQGVLALDPNSVRAYDNLGLCYDMMGLVDDARKVLDQAATLNRKAVKPSPWPPHDLGYLLLRMEDFKQAEQSLKEAIRYDPNFALGHYHLGRVLEKEDRKEQAIEEYRQAAALDERIPEPLYSLGLLCRRQGRNDEAKRAFAEYKRRKALAGATQ